jgi:hypothetical protein
VDDFPALAAADFGVHSSHGGLFAHDTSGASYANDNAAILSVGLDMGIDAELRVRSFWSFDCFVLFRSFFPAQFGVFPPLAVQSPELADISRSLQHALADNPGAFANLFLHV